MAQRAWTARDILDQSGSVAVVTGANSGIGLVTARELARAGARVVMACRDVERGEQAAAQVRAEVDTAAVEVERLDLADLASVRSFAAGLGERHAELDLLVNNAGVMALPNRRTADGFELQLGTNHLGHFALTGLLLVALQHAEAPRVVTVSSGLHRLGRIDFDDLNSERRYSRWKAYAQSKVANLLFAFELQRRAAATGSALDSLASHPGYTATNLQLAGPRMSGSRIGQAVMTLANRLVAQDDEMGALPSLYAATAPDLPGGSYVGPDGPFEQRGHPTLVSASARARDQGTAQRLWERSEQLTGVVYDW